MPGLSGGDIGLFWSVATRDQREVAFFFHLKYQTHLPTYLPWESKVERRQSWGLAGEVLLWKVPLVVGEGDQLPFMQKK